MYGPVSLKLLWAKIPCMVCYTVLREVMKHNLQKYKKKEGFGIHYKPEQVRDIKW